MNNFLSLKLYKNNDLYLEKKLLNYAKTNNKYEFSLEDVLNTIIISEDAMVLTRDNKESTLELTVNKNGNHKCRYLLKELDAYVDIVVDSAEFSIQDDKLELYYQLESDDQFTRLEINNILPPSQFM